MQSKIVQAVICHNCDDYGLQLMKTQIHNLRKLEYCEKVQYSRLKVSHSNQLIKPKHQQKVPEPLKGH